MDDKTLVCIGGASGMGRGIAEAARARSANVIVTSRKQASAETTAREIGARGMAVDITDPSSVDTFFQDVGSFDYLAITAGATGRARFSDTPPAQAREFMDAKLWATHQCLWAAKPYLNNDSSVALITGGYSTTVTNEAGHVHVAFQAVEAMARSAAVAFAPIRCNVFRPGFIDSALWDFMSDEAREELRETERAKTLIGQIVSPIAFGEAVLKVMTSKAITGAIIPVDGGRSLWQPKA